MGGVDNESNLSGIQKRVLQKFAEGQTRSEQISQAIELGSLLSASGSSTSSSSTSSYDEQMNSLFSSLTSSMNRQMRFMNTMNTINMVSNAATSILGILGGSASLQSAVSSAASGGTSSEQTLSKLDLKCSEKKLSKQIDERRSYISSMDSKISGYESEISTKSQSKSSLEADNADRNSKKAGYQAAVDTKTEEYNNAVKAWTDASEELKGLPAKITSAKSNVDSINNQIDSLVTQKSQAQTKQAKAQIEQQIKNIKENQLKKAQEELDKLNARKAELEDNDADKSVAGLKAKMDAADAAKKQAIQENSDNLAKIEDNEKQIATLKSEIDKLNQDKQAAQTKRNNANNELTQLQDALKEKQSK